MALLREGEVVRGTYEVERLLGEGAFGEVYRVKHRFLGRQAMKVFKAAGMTEQEQTKLNPKDVEELLLVGGPTKMPVLRDMLADASTGLGIPLEFTIDPLTVVTRGAAIFAGSQRVKAVPAGKGGQAADGVRQLGAPLRVHRARGSVRRRRQG